MNIYKYSRKFLITPLTILLSTLILSSCGGGGGSSGGGDPTPEGGIYFHLKLPKVLLTTSGWGTLQKAQFKLIDDPKNPCLEGLTSKGPFSKSPPLWMQPYGDPCSVTISLNQSSQHTYTMTMQPGLEPTFGDNNIDLKLLKTDLNQFLQLTPAQINSGAGFTLTPGINSLSISFTPPKITPPSIPYTKKNIIAKTGVKGPLAITLIGGKNSNDIPFCWSNPDGTTAHTAIAYEDINNDCKLNLGFNEIDGSHIKEGAPTLITFHNGAAKKDSYEAALYSKDKRFLTWIQSYARNLGKTIDVNNTLNFTTSPLPFPITTSSPTSPSPTSLIKTQNLDTLASMLVPLVSSDLSKLIDDYKNGAENDKDTTTSMTIARVMLVDAAMMKLTYNNNDFSSQFKKYHENLEALISLYQNEFLKSQTYLAPDCDHLIVYNTKEAADHPALATTSLLADSYMAAAMTMYQSLPVTDKFHEYKNSEFAVAFLKDFVQHDMDQASGSPQPSGRFPPLKLTGPNKSVTAYSQMAPQILLLSTPSKDKDAGVVNTYQDVVTSAFNDLYNNVNPDSEDLKRIVELPYRYNTSPYNDSKTQKPVDPLPPEYYPSLRGDFAFDTAESLWSPWMPGLQITPYHNNCTNPSGQPTDCGRYEFDPHILGRLGGLLLTSKLDDDAGNFYKLTLDATRKYMDSVDMITKYLSDTTTTSNTAATTSSYYDKNNIMHCLGAQAPGISPNQPVCENIFSKISVLVFTQKPTGPSWIGETAGCEKGVKKCGEKTHMPVLCDYMLARLGLLDISTIDDAKDPKLTPVNSFLTAIKTYVYASTPDNDDRMALLLAGFYMDGVFNEQKGTGIYPNQLVKYHNKMSTLFGHKLPSQG